MKRVMMIATIVVICFVVMGTDDCQKDSYEGQGDTQRLEAQKTEQNQKRLIVSTPPPQLSKSLERENLKRRLQRFNDADKVSYIYLVGNTGVVMSFMPIKGKVSSVNSKLTTGEQVVDDPYGYRESGGRVVESPQMDGSYGTNGDAIFFFTTEDVYVEWNGFYMLCDQPLLLSTPPLMVYRMGQKEM